MLYTGDLHSTSLIRCAGLLVFPSGESEHKVLAVGGHYVPTLQYGAAAQNGGALLEAAYAQAGSCHCAAATHAACISSRVDRTHTAPLTLCRSPSCCEGGVCSHLPAPPAARDCCDSAPTRAPVSPLVPTSASSEPVGLVCTPCLACPAGGQARPSPADGDRRARPAVGARHD